MDEKNIKITAMGESTNPPGFAPPTAAVSKPPRQQHQRPHRLVIMVIVVSLLAGAVGGAAGSRYLSTYWPFNQLDGSSGEAVVGKSEKITVEEDSAIISAVQDVRPAVVSITATSNIQDFFGNVHAQSGTGTGFVITSDGLILTNRHVVEQASEYTVLLNDGQSYAAEIASLDPVSDLAILRIEAKNLPVGQLGNSDDLQVGQRVIAIGNALGQYDNTVTTGIISAKNRQINASDARLGTSSLSGLLQTDATINLGNSGGPLVNLAGQVVGINTAVDAQAEQIGFAIPINDAKAAIDSFKENGKIIRPYIGVSYVMLDETIANLNNLPIDEGALIYSADLNNPAVIAGSPAAKAGLRRNDIVVKIDDQEIDEDNPLSQVIQKYKPGDKIVVGYQRGDQTKTLEVVLGELGE